MKPVLGRKGLEAIRQFAGSRTALVLDYDGTLSPIVPAVGQALIPPKTKRLLREATRLYPTAVLSGRKLSDVSSRVRGLGVREIVGNHGIEWRGSRHLARYVRLMQQCRRQLSRAMREGAIDGRGLEIENKKVTLSVHYRLSPRPARAQREILEVLRQIPGIRVIEGKCVFNVLPEGNESKGTAVLALRKKLRCERVIFAGDDWTDEKVFELRSKAFLLDVRVGRSTRSSARYYLPNIAAMDRFLAELIRLRRD